jgi:hypothetical protein
VRGRTCPCGEARPSLPAFPGLVTFCLSRARNIMCLKGSQPSVYQGLVTCCLPLAQGGDDRLNDVPARGERRAPAGRQDLHYPHPPRPAAQPAGALTLNPQHSTLNTQHSTLNPQSPTLNPQPSTLNFQPSTLNPQPSTLNLAPSTLNPQPSTLNPQPSTLHPQP